MGWNRRGNARVGAASLAAILAVGVTACGDGGSRGRGGGAGDDADAGADSGGGGGDATPDSGGGAAGGDAGGDAGGAADSGGMDEGDAGTGLPGADGGDGGDEPVVPGLRALRVEPADADVVDDGVVPGETAAFRAVGTFEAGDRDVTDEVVWTLESPDVGTLERGLFTSAGIGGTSRVTARARGRAASAEVRVTLEARGLAADAPAGAADLFPADRSGDRTGVPDAPLIVYPSHETMFPRNLERVLYQWRAGAALDLFEVRFDSERAHLRWYTGARSLLPDAAGWRWLAFTHAGGSVEMTVRGLATSAPATVYASAPVTIHFSASEVIGALYYWSTGAAGVMRAKISSAAAEKFFTEPTAGDNTCVSCHTVSRDGRRLAAGYGGERLRAITIPEREVLVPAPPATNGPAYGWGTFNPGATRLLYASSGVLTLLDGATGAVLNADVLGGAAQASMPDWSPDGRFVAVAYSETEDLKNKQVQGTSIARIPVDGDTFGAPEVLVASAGDNDTLYFPTHSPDSRWIAFVRGTGRSKDNKTSEVFIVRSDGSGEPLALARLNRRVRHEDGITGIGNAMPTWAPSTRPEINWLAFSSLRAYGDILASDARDQLWGAAIDLAAVERRDAAAASYAAFWMPFQALDEGNHRAFWALATEETCPATVEVCDGLDNDCDGFVDDDCCTPEAETCGDGLDNNCDGFVDDGCCLAEPEVCDDALDNDCDGVTDDGCGCLSVEDCGNGADDDCDGLTDDADEDCATSSCTAETCDGLDNDCDGTVDDGATCASGDACWCGMCAAACFRGECIGGTTCSGEFCVRDACPLGTACQAGACVLIIP